MSRKLWLKTALIILSAGSTLAIATGGCLETTAQRVLVGVVVN